MERHVVIEIVVKEACKLYAIRKGEIQDPNQRHFTVRARATILHLMDKTGLFGDARGCLAAYKMHGDLKLVRKHSKFLSCPDYKRRISIIQTKLQKYVEQQSITPH